ncbi:MAG: FMN-binding protein [Desulfosoma sp.]|uniref:FMN-binding protein n=1 Tax=Desulfosoma sp. TaxID=2603217 RepID=UPI004049489C
MKGRMFSTLYIFVLSLVFTSVVSGLNGINQDRIRLNEERKRQALVLHVLHIALDPLATDQDVALTFSRRVRTASLGDRPLYVGLEADASTVVGYAFPVTGPGFWGPIEAMLAVDPQGQSILGIAFYRHSETPGLGGRITEEWFQKQFQGRPLKIPPAGMRFFYFKTPGTASGPSELDAITGATETTRRLEMFLDEELKKTIPLLLEQKKMQRV